MLVTCGTWANRSFTFAESWVCALSIAPILSLTLRHSACDSQATGMLARLSVYGPRRSYDLIRDAVTPQLQSLQATWVCFKHSSPRPTSTQGVQQPEQADPFTSSLQSKTEKELLEQVLRQAQQEDLAEEAAEQKRVDQRGEHGGPKGEEPTRFGDWEKGGRCYDF